jgi:hypothetical protein
MRRALPQLFVVLVSGAVLLAGCGDGGGRTTPPTGPEAVALTAAAPDAAALRVGLTALLEDHVYGTAAAAGTTLAKGPRSRAAVAALRTLDRNSIALAQAIGGVYGPRAGGRFLTLWRAHNASIAAYTRARLAHDDAAAEVARRGLDEYRARFGALLADADPDLPQDAVAAALKPQIAAQLAAVDAASIRTLGAARVTAAAAATAPAFAAVIAGAVSKQFPERFRGSADSPRARIAATLTAQLADHLWLTLTATATGVRAGLDSGEFLGAATTVDANTAALASTVDTLYGAPTGRRFAALWHRRVGAIIDYTRAETIRDGAGARRAIAALWHLRRGLRTVLGGGVSSPAAITGRTELRRADELLLGAIRAQVTGSPQAAPRSARAAAAMSGLAGTLLAGARPAA